MGNIYFVKQSDFSKSGNHRNVNQGGADTIRSKDREGFISSPSWTSSKEGKPESRKGKTFVKKVMHKEKQNLEEERTETRDSHLGRLLAKSDIKLKKRKELRKTAGNRFGSSLGKRYIRERNPTLSRWLPG